MKKAFKINIPLGFSQEFSLYRPDTALRHFTQELERSTKEETAYALDMPTVVLENLEAWLGSGWLYFLLR